MPDDQFTPSLFDVALVRLEPIAQKMNETAQKYYDTSRPAYCAPDYRGSGKLAGRVALITTTARGHGNRGVRPGSAAPAPLVKGSAWAGVDSLRSTVLDCR